MSKIVKTVFATFKKSTWAIILYESGILRCKGPGYGAWGTGEHTINYGSVLNVWGAGTSKGPGILYYSKGSLRAVFLRFNTGKTVVSGVVSNQEPSAVRVEPHRYGVVFYVTLEGRVLRVEIDGWGHLKSE